LRAGELFKIKLEIDCDPPPDAQFEIKYALPPLPFAVRLFTPPCIFAGKMHAVLCRSWKTRIKGLDLYDYVWYLSRNVPVHLDHLSARMRQTGYLSMTDNIEYKVKRPTFTPNQNPGCCATAHPRVFGPSETMPLPAFDNTSKPGQNGLVSFPNLHAERQSRPEAWGRIKRVDKKN
jgi:hypothetical protein